MKKRTTLLALSLIGMILVTGSVDADTASVIATGSAVGTGNFDSAALGGFDPTVAGGADKLVVTYSDEGGRPDAITYAGQSLSRIIIMANVRIADMWYLDFAVPATLGDLVVSGANGGISIMALKNTAKGFGAKASATSGSVALDPLYDGSVVVAAYADNGDGTPSANSPLTPVLLAAALGGGAKGASGYYAPAAAGLQTFSFSPGGNAIVAVAFPALGTDTNAPVITAVSAIDDAGNPTTNLATDPILTLEFDESIFPGTGSILLKEDGGATVGTYDVTSAAELDFGVASLTITPEVLDPETSYFVQIPTGAVEDGSGNTTTYPDSALTLTTGPWLTANFRVSGEGTYSSAALRGFDPSGYDKLVVIVMGEGDTASSVTWGESSAMIKAASAGSGRNVSLWYLDGPFSGRDSLTLSGSLSGYGFSLLALPGTDPGVAAADSVESASIDFATTSDDSFVVAGLCVNGGGAPAFGAAPLYTYFSRDTYSSDGACAVTESSTAGAQTFSFTGNTSSPAMVIVEFVKTPPPPGTVVLIR